MISEFWTFGVQNLFVRTREPFFSNLRTFGLKHRRTHEPSNLRTFGRMGCNPYICTKAYTHFVSIPQFMLPCYNCITQDNVAAVMLGRYIYC